MRFPEVWQYPDIQRLEGVSVAVARLDPANDIDELYESSHGDENIAVWKYLHNGPFRDKAAMLEWMRSLNERTDAVFYSVFSLSAGKKVGMISIMNISVKDGKAELGYIWYSPFAQRTSVNTEVIYLFLGYLFDTLKYRRVEWKCDTRNERSRRAALRMGFVFEGVFRHHMVVKDQSRDTAWFATLDEEWPLRKKNFELALASSDVSLATLNGLPNEP